MSNQTNFSETAARILSDAQRVQTMGNTVSGKLLALYKECGNPDTFDNACNVAETDWKAKRAKAGADTRLPSCWSQAKSDIKGAVKAGIDVSPYETVSSLKKAKVQANKVAKELTAKAKGSSVATIGSGATVGELATGSAVTLLELLDNMPADLKAAMLDSFIEQANKALQALADGSVTAEVKQTVKLAKAS